MVLSPEVLLVIVAFISALVGALLTWIVGYLTGGDQGERQRSKPAVTAGRLGPGDAAPPGEQELLRVSRVNGDRLAVFVQGRRYRRLQEITDRQVGRETIKALRVVLAFAESWLPAPRQAPPQPAPSKTTVDEETFLEQLRQRDLFSLGEPSGSPGQPRKRTAPPPLLTPAEEIDNLVQQRLQERPGLARHSIRLTTGADGSLCIHVGLQTFEAVNDVPDLEVRALIQDAIREWEGD